MLEEIYFHLCFLLTNVVAGIFLIQAVKSADNFVSKFHLNKIVCGKLNKDNWYFTNLFTLYVLHLFQILSPTSLFTCCFFFNFLSRQVLLYFRWMIGCYFSLFMFLFIKPFLPQWLLFNFFCWLMLWNTFSFYKGCLVYIFPPCFVAVVLVTHQLKKIHSQWQSAKLAWKLLLNETFVFLCIF